MTESKRLLNCIGEDAMDRLCREFGGTKIYVPKHPPAKERIVFEFHSARKQTGLTCMAAYQTVAEEYDISVRQVQRIVAG